MAQRDDVMTLGCGRATFALLALSLAGCGSAGSNTGAGGAGGSLSVANGSTSKAATSTGAKSSSNAVASTSTGSTFVCDPAAPPGSLYEKSATQLANIDPTSMCEYRGDVLLIVDTAGA